MFNPLGMAYNGIKNAFAETPSSAESATHTNIIKQTMADLKDAGLNPVLGLESGLSASSSAFSAETSAKAQVKAQKIAGLFSIISSAMSLAGGMFGKK